MKDWNLVFAGFGGQGILFAGKVTAYAGMMEGREVSWLPSYGPEMRGGTANCSVCLAGRPIGSPLVLEPDALDRKTDRSDITALYIPATRLAQDNGIGKLANLIMLGALWKATGFATLESLEAAIQKVVPPSKQELVELNMKAIRLGIETAK